MKRLRVLLLPPEWDASPSQDYSQQYVAGTHLYTWGLFLETPDNFPGPKTILGAQYSGIAIQFLLIFKARF